MTTSSWFHLHHNQHHQHHRHHHRPRRRHRRSRGRRRRRHHRHRHHCYHYTGKGGGVMFSFVLSSCLSFIRSLCDRPNSRSW